MGFPRKINWQGSGAAVLNLDIASGNVRVRLDNLPSLKERAGRERTGGESQPLILAEPTSHQGDEQQLKAQESQLQEEEDHTEESEVLQT